MRNYRWSIGIITISVITSVIAFQRYVGGTQQADLNHDGIDEAYRLINGRLIIEENRVILWTSPPQWIVDHMVLADVTNDGVPDIVLSVWKPGNFGPSKPFWVRDNDQTVKNHLFIYNLRGSQMMPVWQSSNLEVPDCSITVNDENQHGVNDLIVEEGTYTRTTVPQCIVRHWARWRWNGWGFTNIERL